MKEEKVKEIKNKNKLKLIEDTNLLITQEFGNLKPGKITRQRLSLFMEKINPFIQEYAHKVIKTKGVIQHVERKLVKRRARLIVLNELGKKYPEQVIEYLFNKSYKIKFDTDKRR